ncbi:MAG: biotin--[acetyl-CoA-carboxylase] ligase [candidate division WOR-3 bacterium]
MKILHIDNLRFGHTVYTFLSIDSTQNKALELARQGEKEGVVVSAQIQTAGRGRHNEVWVSEKGGLYFSIIYRPKIVLSEVIGLTKLIGQSVKKTIERVLGQKYINTELKIKGINDIYFNNRKLAGILIETESNIQGESCNPQFYIIGIGINVNQKHFPRRYESIATSLRIETERKFSRYQLLKLICENLSNILPS